MESNTSSEDFRIYSRKKSAVFKKTSEKWGGLSNMAPGYPLVVNGVYIRSAEALYQACRYPDQPEIQRKIISQTSPMTAKMVGKPYRSATRSDWGKKRVVIMKWCLRVKLIQNYDKFSTLLQETGNLDIVEDSDKDDFWGAKPIDPNTLKGVNALGRLLMELREILNRKSRDDFLSVSPPGLDNFNLLGEKVRVVSARDIAPYKDSQDSLFDV